MKISTLTLSNFRGFRNVSIELHPSFNLFIGINGTGKSSILEGLRIATGALFLDMDKVKDKIYTPTISQEDVRLEHLEKQFPVSIEAKGLILGSEKEEIWSRELNSESGRTTTGKAKSIKAASGKIQQIVRSGNTSIPIPLVAFYSVDRFKREKYDIGIEPEGSRLRGYFNSMDLLTNFQFFKDLFRTQAFSEIQKGEPSGMILAVKNAVKTCIDSCEWIQHDIQRDKLIVKLTGGEEVPFEMLSDGIRGMLSMVMELSLRCYLLNPWLGINAPLQTPGVVLIDEIDLHIHPAWQRKIIQDFGKAFPQIQFFATTHSPIVVSALQKGSIFALKDFEVYTIQPQYGKDANSVLQEMGVEERQPEIQVLIDQYYLLIEAGKGEREDALKIRTQLDELLGSGSSDLQRADAMLSFF